MNISVIGCGYVGLITGVGLALQGHDVTAVDTSTARVRSIQRMIPPFHEPGLAAALKKVISARRLKATNDLKTVAHSDVIFICVGTPSEKDGSIDLSMVRRSIEQMAPHLSQGDHPQVLVIRSTVIPGTAESVVSPLVEGINKLRKHPLWIASNPEFLREGRALDDFLNPDRIVIGSLKREGGDFLARLYRRSSGPVLRTSSTEAEMVKYASNTLLAVLISYSNEIARLCETLPGVDADRVFDALHLDRRFSMGEGRHQKPAGITTYLRAGCGFGGSCLPKDLRAMIAFAKSRGLQPRLLDAALSVNQTQPAHFVTMAERWSGSFKGRKVAVLGLSFKDGTDDLRESPGIDIALRLLARGASLILSDPLVLRKNLPASLHSVPFKRDPVTAFNRSDVCILTTSAPEFRFIEKRAFVTGQKGRIVIDGRRMFKSIHSIPPTAMWGIGQGAI